MQGAMLRRALWCSRAGACAALRQRHAHVRTATLRSALVTTTAVAVRHAGSSQSLPATAAAAATTMFVRDDGDTSLDTLSLDAVLQHLQRFLQQQQQQHDVTCVQRALERVVQLDVSDDDTRRIAALPLVAADATQPHNNNNNSSSRSVDATASPLRRHLVLQCMHDYPHAPSLRACCCRCLANMCQLPTASATTTTTDDDSRHAAVSSTSSSSTSLAEQLVQQGAIEAIVGTLRMSARLRAHERRWAAQALANVVCLSHSGAARAAAAGAERAIAEFVLHLLDEHDTGTTTTNASASVATAAAAAATTATRRRDDVCTALDAALASLGAVLAAVAPENAQCASHNYERVHYVAVDAMVRALLWCSAWLVRDGRDDGVCSGVLPPRRPRTHTLQYTTTNNNNNDNDNDADASRMTSRQRTALLRGLPLLHKTLLALQHVCAHAANMPLVYTALDDVASTTTTTATMTTTTRTMALQCVLDAIEFVTLHVVVVGENNSDDNDDDGEAAMLRSLQRDVHAWSLDCIAALSTPRRHHDSSSSSSSADHTREEVTSADDATRATATHALVSPTRAAHVVTHVLMSGTASRLALSTVVRTRNSNNNNNSNNNDKACDDSLRCYREHDYALLTQALTVLTHMACLSAAATTTSSRDNDNDNDDDDAVSSDCVVASRNTVAALETLLIDAHDTLRTLASALHTNDNNSSDNNDANDKTAYTALQLQLFVSSEGATSGDTTTTTTTTAVQHRRVAVQQLTLTTHVYAVLWALLAQHEAANDSNNSNTVPLVSTRTLDIVRALHAMLCDVYVRAADDAAAAAAAATALRSETGTRTSMSSSLSSSSLSSQQQREKAVAWVSTRVEEQLRRAVQLGARLLDCAVRRDGAARHQDDDKQ